MLNMIKNNTGSCKLDYSNKSMLSESFLLYFLEFCEKPDVKRYVKSNFQIIHKSLKNTYDNLLKNNDYKDFDIKYQYSLINSCSSIYSKMYIYIRCKFLEWIMVDKSIEDFRQANKEYQEYVSNNVIELAIYYQNYKNKLIQNRTEIMDGAFLEKLDIWCRKSQERSEERYKREFVVYTLMKECNEINSSILNKGIDNSKYLN